MTYEWKASAVQYFAFLEFYNTLQKELIRFVPIALEPNLPFRPGLSAE